MSLDEFQTDLGKTGFIRSTDKETITLLDRVSTKGGSPKNYTFNLNYNEILQAVLKVNLLADQGKILGFIPNEFKLVNITVNGHTFTPSDYRNSINIIDRSNTVKRVLNPSGVNSISIDFNAPVGAGVVSPDAELSAFLILNGDKKALPALPNTTQLKKDLGGFLTNIRDNSFWLLVVIMISLIAVATIVYKVKVV